jgi:hypothetical protein
MSNRRTLRPGYISRIGSGVRRRRMAERLGEDQPPMLAEVVKPGAYRKRAPKAGATWKDAEIARRDGKPNPLQRGPEGLKGVFRAQPRERTLVGKDRIRARRAR